MRNSSYIKSAKAQAALELSPPLIRDTLITDKAFRQEYGFSADASLIFGENGIAFSRSELFDSIRKILSDGAELCVQDSDNKKWKLTIESESEDLPTLVISTEKQKLLLPDFLSLSPDASVRLHSFEKAALDVNLPDYAKDLWTTILSKRALEDEEVAEYHKDIHDTPTHVMRKIFDEIKKGKSSLPTLVPSSRKYYDRLVGAYDGSVSINEYTAGGAKDFIPR